MMGITRQEITISAVIPAYNAEKYISRSIDSVLNQTCPVDEIIVVDDGSTDTTPEMIARYGEKVRYIHQPNAGVSAARNTGIQTAEGNWIAFLDADDEWLPKKIELQIYHLQNNPDLVWTTGNYIECLCDENRFAPHSSISKCISCQSGKDYYESYFRAIQLYQWGHTICMLIQRDVFDKVGAFNTELPIGEDLDLWLRISYCYPKVGFIPEPISVHHLAVSDTLMTTPRSGSIYTGFMVRHFKIAKTQGVADQFMPAATAIMQRWIRGMLFKRRKAEIRELIDTFSEAFSVGYRFTMYGLTLFPLATACGLKLISKTIRLLKLRGRITRPPM